LEKENLRDPVVRKNIAVFITTDKDDEPRIDTNRYILLHIVDCAFATALQNMPNYLEFTKRNMEIDGFLKINVENQDYCRN